jgi:hypothetical protein
VVLMTIVHSKREKQIMCLSLFRYSLDSFCTCPVDGTLKSLIDGLHCILVVLREDI